MGVTESLKHNRLNIALFSMNILFLLIGLALGSVWVVLNADYIEYFFNLNHC